MKAISEPTEPFVERGPGGRLREAREAANITVDKVATSLLLDSDTIRALEADAFDRLPAPTFVRGYLRGYARVVGLPAGPILDMYNRRGFEPPPLATGVSESSQAHTSDTAVRLVTYAVAAVLVVLVALWWHSQEGSGFDIGGDLFDWLSDPDPNPDSEPDPDSDSSLAFADAPGSEAFGEPAESTRDGEPLVPSTGQDTEPDDGATGPASADVAVPAAVTESGTSTTSTPQPEIAGEGNATIEADLAAEASPAAATPPIADNVAAADDAPAVAGEPATADTLTAAGEPATGDGSATAADNAAGEPVAGDDTATATAAGLTTAGGTTAEADSTAVTLAARGESAAEAGSTAGDEAADAAIPTPASPTGTDTSLTRSAPASSDAEASTRAATTQSGVVLEFLHESWVEVYDRERARLFFGLVQPGRVLEFDGAQPFDVLLGFGKDVRVTIDGEAFDHTPYMKHGVARFKLGTPLSVEAETAGSTTAAEPDAATEPDADGTRTEPDAATEPGTATEPGAATDTGRSAADGETTDDTAASGGTSTRSP